jgi:hypothetical protein
MYVEVVSNVPFFAGANVEFVKRVVLSLDDSVFLPGDFILVAGESGQEMFFLIQGLVVVMAPKPTGDPGPQVAELRPGPKAFFGEMALLTDAKRSAFIRANTYCVCSCLSQVLFLSLLTDFPDEVYKIKEIARPRLEELKAAGKPTGESMLDQVGKGRRSSRSMTVGSDEEGGETPTPKRGRGITSPSRSKDRTMSNANKKDLSINVPKFDLSASEDSDEDYELGRGDRRMSPPSPQALANERRRNAPQSAHVRHGGRTRTLTRSGTMSPGIESPGVDATVRIEEMSAQITEIHKMLAKIFRVNSKTHPDRTLERSGTEVSREFGLARPKESKDQVDTVPGEANFENGS